MLEQWLQKDNIEPNILFNTIFETVADGIFVFGLDGRVVQVNQALLTLLEARPEELIGQYNYQVMADFNLSAKNGCSLIAEQLLSSKILRQHTLKHLKNDDISITLHSGREIIVNITSSPMLDQKNQLVGCISIFHDITEQSQKENRIFHAFNSLLTFIETLANSPNQEQSSVIHDEENTPPITLAGKFMTEVIAEVLDCQFAEVFLLENPEQRQHVIAVSGLSACEEELFREGSERTLFSDYLEAATIDQLRDNQVVTLDLLGQPFVTPHSDFGARYRLIAPIVLSGKLFGVFIIAKTDKRYADVTNAYSPGEIVLAQDVAKFTTLVIERVRLLQKWAEANARDLALQEANRRHDDFMSNTSHELRTPLTTFKANAELALRRLEKLTKRIEYEQSLTKSLEDIKQPLSYAISRANLHARVISDLLDSSRIQQIHVLTMLMEPFDLFAIVRSTVEDIRLIVEDRTIVLHETENEHFSLYGDAERISQVVFNYISNALKYSPVTSPIEVRVTRKGLFASVTVHDEGSGLSVENQAKIWERFYQVPDVEAQYKAGADGLGLGLYLSRKIIEQHHGLVGVQSAPGKGSTFWFDLPLMSS